MVRRAEVAPESREARSILPRLIRSRFNRMKPMPDDSHDRVLGFFALNLDTARRDLSIRELAEVIREVLGEGEVEALIRALTRKDR